MTFARLTLTFLTGLLLAAAPAFAQPSTIEISFYVLTDASGEPAVDAEDVEDYFRAAQSAALRLPDGPTLIRCDEPFTVVDGGGLDDFTSGQASGFASGISEPGGFNIFLGAGIQGRGRCDFQQFAGLFVEVADPECDVEDLVAGYVAYRITTTPRGLTEATCDPIGTPDPEASPSTTVSVRARTLGSNGRAQFVVQQMATDAVGEGNRVVAEAGPFTVQSREFGRYNARFAATVPVERYRIRYINDDGGERDLEVRSIDVDGERFVTTSVSTYSTGTFDRETRCAPGFKLSSVLNCNGYFQYSIDSDDVVSSRSNGGLNGDLSFAVFPNPSSAAVSVRLPVSDSEESVALEVFDAAGQRVLTRLGVEFGSTVELGESLPAGTYTLQARGGDYFETTRFVRLR